MSFTLFNTIGTRFQATTLACALVSSLAIVGPTAAATATFDDLALPPSSHYFPAADTTINSGGASFKHDYSDFGVPDCCWTGWTYSNETDVTTAGYTNQFSAYAGSGAQGSANYGVAYLGEPDIGFDAPVAAQGAYITNTTYAALSMLNGDAFSKKFGGASGNDADFLKLTITGYDANALTTGSVDFYLADYRFADNSQDYLIKGWTYVDLSSLGTVSSLRFSLASSDASSFGINTPAYFALDSLSVTAVPEPGSSALFSLGALMLALAARRGVHRARQVGPSA
jgi:Domain of unknown function (DUF4465)